MPKEIQNLQRRRTKLLCVGRRRPRVTSGDILELAYDDGTTSTMIMATVDVVHDDGAYLVTVNRIDSDIPGCVAGDNIIVHQDFVHAVVHTHR